MDITLGKKQRASHYFVFHGRARAYFFICLVQYYTVSNYFRDIHSLGMGT